MRYCAINTKTDIPVQMPAGGKEIPPDIQFFYLPRIRCLDCTGKLYTPGPETTVTNFAVHFRNGRHKEKVAARLARTAAGDGGSGGATPGSAPAVSASPSTPAAAGGSSAAPAEPRPSS